ncbi:MAG: hypothetical protein M1832_005533 [Thelocarpon impressellum]|nr:MAG: hypothetical protein M1832_005533 [Thelocarpon impressellum]
MTSDYADNPPQLGDIPTLDTAGNGQATQKSGFASTAQSALNNVSNHPVTQNVKDTVNNGSPPVPIVRPEAHPPGPVGQSVKSEYANTAGEFQNLANARTRPSQTAATGQQLTRASHPASSPFDYIDAPVDYHSMFSNLLSWENPRATTIAFLSNVLFIFAARYVPIVHYTTKLLYLALGATATAEIAGRLLFSNGFVSQMRPRKYYVLPRETVDQVLEDIHELLNFFVIEFQRVLFAENIYVTVAAFFASLTTYLLIKIVPFWGLTLLGTVAVYLGPWVYKNNKEVIDAQIEAGSDVLAKQAAQMRELAGQHTARAQETAKRYAGDYSAKAQGYIGQARQRIPSAGGKAVTPPADVKSSDFPAAPKSGLKGSRKSDTPLAA